MTQSHRRRREVGEGVGQLALPLELPAAPSEAPPLVPRRTSGPLVTTDVTPTERRRRGDAHAAAARLQAALVRLGLRGIDRVRLTRNRTVMVSFSQGELRVHEGYLDAPPEVLKAIVGFVCGRTRAERRRAREAILAHQIARPAAVRRLERTRPEDEPVVAQLHRFHAHYNGVYFGKRLRAVPIRLSSRMRTRLGHYTAATPTGDPAEIVIGREHIRRHGWEEALHTLLHEMVHQWQDESGHAIDHGATFRKKAREVGITPSARRHVLPRRQRAAPPAAAAIGLRAAREE
ncbi:MAG: SprT-like domain-containing protein [Gemmatirosa sp.]